MIQASTSVAPAAPNAPDTSAQSNPKPESSGFSFHDLLEIVNPLQHIPIVSTIYRALTGDKPKTFDKVAGDLLYGGPIGFVASLADSVFEKVTGKDFGSTVLAFFTGSGGSAPTNVASKAGPAPTTATTQSPKQAGAAFVPASLPQTQDMTSLWNSLSLKGIDATTAQQAALAYQRAINLSSPQLFTGPPTS